MGSFEPLINLLMLLTVLSVVSERITNLLKLRKTELRKPTKNTDKERQREFSISLYGFILGIVLAITVKANFFEILTHLDDPWQTLGWVKMQRNELIIASVAKGIGTTLYALFGCILTGVGLGFGSKFWHDILGAVYEVRSVVRNIKERGISRSR